MHWSGWHWYMAGESWSKFHGLSLRGRGAPAKALCSLLVPTQLCFLAGGSQAQENYPGHHPAEVGTAQPGMFINSLIKTRIYRLKIKEFISVDAVKVIFH